MSRFVRALVSLLVVVMATPASAGAATGALDSATSLPSAHPPAAPADAADSAYPASPAPATPTPGNELESKPATPPVAEAKSGGLALGYSILVPIATGAMGVGVIWAGRDLKGPGFLGGLLIFGALTVAPSAGHLYTGEFGRAALFSLGRTAAVSLAAFSLGNVICYQNCSGFGDPGLIGLALTSWAVLTVVDVIDSPASARRANQRSMSLAPMVLQERGPDLQPITFGGLQLATPF